MAREFVTVEVQGLAESEAALKDLVENLGVSNATARNTIGRVLVFAGQPVEEAAKAAVPVKKGKLRASIATSRKLSRRQKAQHTPIAPIEAYVGAGSLPQAHMQEFGTAHHAPKPFLRPAVDSKVDEVRQRFADQLKVEIEKVAARARRKLARLQAKGK